MDVAEKLGVVGRCLPVIVKETGADHRRGFGQGHPAHIQAVKDRKVTGRAEMKQLAIRLLASGRG